MGKWKYIKYDLFDTFSVFFTCKGELLESTVEAIEHRKI